MITKDLQAYAISSWGDFLRSITELSKSDEGVSLIESPVQLYNFDDLCKSLFAPGKAPTSADGLDCSGKTVELIEFKSGFRQRITKQNFDPVRGRCPDPDVNRVCEDYWKIFFENQKLKIEKNISSIRFKAVESYVTLEKQIFPRCQDARKPISLKLVVVIDEDEIDCMEDTYSELAGNTDAENTADKDNHFSAIRSALRRLTNQHDANGNDCFYDHIEVMSVQDYKNRLKLRFDR